MATTATNSLWTDPAAAGLLSVTNRVGADSASAKASLKDVLADDRLIAQVIEELVPQAGIKTARGAYKTVLKADLLKFAIEAKQIVWRRSDIEGYLSILAGKKCGLNLSCQVAFDLAPSQINNYIDELSTSVSQSAEERWSRLNSQLASLEDEAEKIAPESAASLKNSQDIDQVLRQIEDVEAYQIAASRLRKPVDAPDLSELTRACR